MAAGILGLILAQGFTWSEAVLFCLVLCVTWLVYSFGIKPFLSPLRKIPGPSYNPIYGNIRQAMVGEAMESSVGMVKKYGGVVRFYHLLGRERVLIADPKALQHILTINERNYERPVQNQVFGSGIFRVTGDIHRYQRRLLNPFFSRESVNGYLKKFQSHAESLVEYWNEKVLKTEEARPIETEVHNDLLRVMLDMIGDTVLGHQFDHLKKPDCPYANAIHMITSRPLIRWTALLPFGLGEMIPSKANREFKETVRKVFQLLDGIIEEKRKVMCSQEGLAKASTDLLGKLMLVKDEDGRSLTNQELRDQLISFILAGHETTSNGLCWILLTLAQHPEAQTRLRAEVLERLPAEGEDISWETLEAMPYMDAVVKEGLRLYPAAPSFIRRAKADDVIDGYFIPKGTTLIYHVGAMMRNPKLWPEPEKFLPERFLDKEANMAAFMPFAAGLHKCMGYRYALISMKLFIAVFLRKFEFETIPGVKFKRILRVVLKSSPPIRLRLKQIE